MAYQHGQEYGTEDSSGDKLKELIDKLRNKAIANIPTSELVKPDGYASKIAGQLKITRVQLRKIYSELKYIFERVSSVGRLEEDTRTKLYMLYPILEYQKNRGVIDGRFVNLMYALIENLERNETKENFEQAERFLTALVAYTRKEA